MKTEIPGFETRKEGGTLLLTRGPLAEYMAGRPAADLAGEARDTVEGRRIHTVLELPGEARAVVRHYVHGGLLRKVTGSRYAGSERFFEEIRVSEHLRASGVNTPEVLGLFVQTGKLGFCRGALVTRMIEGGKDLLEFLQSDEGVSQVADPVSKRALIRSAAQQTRRMHDAGVCHADLHVKNLLLAPDGWIFILDLDRASIRRKLGRTRRLANLIRLGRSLEKTGVDSVVTGRDTYVFFLEYLRAGSPLKIDPQEVINRYRRHVARHRLFWKLGIR